MPGSGTLTLSGTIVGYPTGQRTVNVQWPLPAAVDESTSSNLSIGDNQFGIPGGASIVIIEPPDGNVVPIVLKGASGDLGLVLHPTLAHVQSINVAMGSFILNISQVLVGPVQITFF